MKQRRVMAIKSCACLSGSTDRQDQLTVRINCIKKYIKRERGWVLLDMALPHRAVTVRDLRGGHKQRMDTTKPGPNGSNWNWEIRKTPMGSPGKANRFGIGLSMFFSLFFYISAPSANRSFVGR